MKIESKYTRQQIEAMKIREIKRLGLPKYRIEFHGFGIVSTPFENYVIDHIREAWLEAKKSGKYHTWKLYQDTQQQPIKTGTF